LILSGATEKGAVGALSTYSPQEMYRKIERCHRLSSGYLRTVIRRRGQNCKSPSTAALMPSPGRERRVSRTVRGASDEKRPPKAARDLEAPHQRETKHCTVALVVL